MGRPCNSIAGFLDDEEYRNFLFGSGIWSSLPHNVGVFGAKRMKPLAQGTLSLCNSISKALRKGGGGISRRHPRVRGRCPECTRPVRVARNRIAQSVTKKKSS